MKYFFNYSIRFGFLFLFLIALISYNNKVFSQNVKTVFLTKGDTTTNLYLLVSPSENVKATAFMFLIPGWGEKPNDVLIQTTLPQYAADHGILTFIPTFLNGVNSFAVDDSTQRSLKEMINDCIQKYHLQNLDFYIGGFSIGGTCAVKYAELAIKDNYKAKPKAVFGIDPPLDFERLYNAEERNLRLMRKIYVNPEAVYVTKRIRQICGGSPKTALVNYYKYSPYSFCDTSQTAVKLLKSTPVSFYAEPDIEWWLKMFGYDYTNLNVVDEAAMVNELRLMGDIKTRLVITHDKGYRMPKKIRMPHSWSILNPKDLIDWFDSLSNTKEN